MTNVGDPIEVRSSAEGNALTFGLEGSGASNFTVTAVDAGAQIAVAPDAYLNYEYTSRYNLTLTVSDGKDPYGNDRPDPAIDHRIAVRIDVEDVPGDDFAVTLEASHTTQTIGEGVVLTARVLYPPVPPGQMSYRHQEQNVGGGRSRTELTSFTTRTVTWSGEPVSREYTLTAWVTAQGLTDRKPLPTKL